jgi:hypothetical protein
MEAKDRKSSPEYLRVRRKLVKKLCEEFDHENWRTLGKISKATYREIADSILAIQGIAILADNQELPPNLVERWSGITDSQQDLLDASFKKVVE